MCKTGKRETLRKRLNRKREKESGRERGEERKKEGRVGWLLIGVNDVENPPIRAFSCVAG